MLCTLLSVLYLSVTCHTPKWPPHGNRRRAPGVIRLEFNGYDLTLQRKHPSSASPPINCAIVLVYEMSLARFVWREPTIMSRSSCITIIVIAIDKTIVIPAIVINEDPTPCTALATNNMMNNFPKAYTARTCINKRYIYVARV